MYYGSLRAEPGGARGKGITINSKKFLYNVAEKKESKRENKNNNNNNKNTQRKAQTSEGTSTSSRLRRVRAAKNIPMSAAWGIFSRKLELV